MTPSDVERFRTAIRRTEYSRPIRVALEMGLISPETTVFDYGCGHGDDLHRLRRKGIPCDGWDPHHRPSTSKQAAHIVNLGFVVNVIEDQVERVEVLREAWSLATSVLLVSTRPSSEERLESGHPFSDGVLTSRGTFQKFYDQLELRSWVEGMLGAQAVSVEPGIVFVFRHEADRHDFLSRRLRRRARAVPRLRQADQLYEKHRDGFEELLAFFVERGRPPKEGEIDSGDFIQEVGSSRKAVQVLRRLLGSEELAALQEGAKQEVLVYLALDRFGRRPRFGELPDALKGDIRAHFGSYKAACEEADRLLFQTGNPLIIDAECRDSAVGKLTPTALYLHTSALSGLSSILRVYEGCARVLLGEVPEANIIKLSRREPSISYLRYPEFEGDPHPALAVSYRVHLRSLRATFRDYRDSGNPPILHRKELFLSSDHPLQARFARLTAQEERWGLLEDQTTIGTQRGWESVLRSASVKLRGHRLIRVTDRSGE